MTMERKERIARVIGQANKRYLMAEHKLQEALVLILIDKHFPKDVIEDFSVSFAGGEENVVSYRQGHEEEDVSLEDLNGMESDEIMEIFNVQY